METEQRIPDEITQRLPRVGRPLPDFRLTDTAGGEVRLGGFRQRQPVLLAFPHGPGCAACAAWLGALVGARAAFDEQNAAVLIVVPGSPEAARDLRSRLDLPFRVLADAAGQTTAEFVPAVGATGGQAPVALYAADRYGYCLARWLADDATGLPSPEVALVPIRDAEQEDCGCGLPAWPVEEVQP
ncbi:MAG TPA: redoxin domain-containing protein [Ktedonobacterales bacterium]